MDLNKKSSRLVRGGWIGSNSMAWALIKSTASDPQLLHRPWLSRSI